MCIPFTYHKFVWDGPNVSSLQLRENRRITIQITCLLIVLLSAAARMPTIPGRHVLSRSCNKSRQLRPKSPPLVTHLKRPTG